MPRLRANIPVSRSPTDTSESPKCWWRCWWPIGHHS